MFRLFENSSLTMKFVTPILVVTLTVLIVGSLFLYNSVKDSTNQQIEFSQMALNIEKEQVEEALMASLRAKVDLIGKFMARTAPDLILSFDFSAMKSYQLQATEDVDIEYATYLKKDGSSLTDYKQPKNKQDILELRYPVETDGETLGYVLIGASKTRINESLSETSIRTNNLIETIKSESKASMNRFMGISFAVCLIAVVLITTILFTLFRVLVTTPLKETGAVFEKMSNGDLTISLDITNNDEIGYMKKCINKSTKEFRKIIYVISSEIAQLNNSAGLLHELSDELSQNAEEQLKEITQVATSMTEMTSTTQEVAKNANATAEDTNEASMAAEEGKRIVSQSIEGINALANDVILASDVIEKLQEDSGSIGTVLDVIKGIAEQTNLLALNAAIEAARAGEQGRGFAVVADEVRTLAGRTQQSTQEIQEMIERLQARASDAVKAIEKGRTQAETSVEYSAKAGDSLERITHVVTKINEMNTQIASASEQQTSMAEEVNQNIININSASEKATVSAENTSVASQDLATLAQNLAQAVNQFKI